MTLCYTHKLKESLEFIVAK